MDALAQDRPVVALGYRGVGGSGGRVAPTVEAMGTDVVAAVAALGLERIDLLGISMGGMVAQAVLANAPELVERAVLTSSGPQGGPGLHRLRRAMVRGTATALLRRTDPRVPLFFTSTPGGRVAAREFLARQRAPRVDRDPAAGPAVLRAQTAAVARWRRRPPPGRSPFEGPVWIVHGDGDRLVPPANAVALHRLLPQADVTVFPDSGHGVVFQHHLAVADRAREFLRR
ncbi:alpha/beta fold hydrolase [Kineococcus sp. NPDC059986]|uniref:alpha/beta fold hydrolase n=1 Tax=Kineococcus sp. NPDC059986 TaxID=3155538 RepID=UPI00344C55CC